jgi:purine-binding chemotaxis protein CheW
MVGRAASAGLGDGARLDSGAPHDDERASDELQLVSFHVAEQEYAIAIEDVQEIVQTPDTIIHVPHAEPHVIGVMTLRSRLLPLVSLRCLFGLDEQPLSDRTRIVVLALGSTSVGVAVDGVSEVLRVDKSCVDAVPALLAKDAAMADISQICRLDGGNRLVSIVTARHLFNHPAIQNALTDTSLMERDVADDLADSAADLDDDEQFVVFRLGKEEFGVPIHSVQEIVRVPDDLVHVPKAPAYVDGVINLRGSVLPVVDLRQRLGLPRVERSVNQRIMVFVLDGVCTGFIVDQVAEVLKIAKSVITPSPNLSSEQGQLLSRMANMESQRRMVQLLEPSFLIDCSDLQDLAGLGA